MEPGDNTLPKPYLNREETDERLRILGFQIKDSLSYPPGYQRPQFQALQELIAGAIAEWADVKDDQDEGTDINAELLEWAEEWLVG